MLKWPVDNQADILFSQEIYVGKDVRFKSLALSVFERDNFTCRFCRFSCPATPEVPNAYFQVHPVDFNYRNLTEDNLITICPFCNSFFNIRASLKSKNYSCIKNDTLKPTQLSVMLKAILAELSSKTNSQYDQAFEMYRELEQFASHIEVPEGPSLHLESVEPGERAKKARANFILSLIALIDGGGYNTQAQIAMNGILPFPLYSAFSQVSDYYEKHVFSLYRKSDALTKIVSRMW